MDRKVVLAAPASRQSNESDDCFAPTRMKTNQLIMRYTTFAFSSLGLAVTIQTTSAQVGAVRQVDSAQQRRELGQPAKTLGDGETVPELYTGEASDVGPQSVVKFKSRKSYLELSADAQYFHTDNMFLSDGGKVGTDVLVSMVQAALAPGAYALGEGQFSPRLGYRHEWFNYGLATSKEIEVFDFNTSEFRQAKLREFDFNAQTVFTDGRWRQGNWIVGAGFDYLRLLDSDRYEQFYDEYVPRWEVRRIIPLRNADAISVAYEGDYRFTDSDLPPSAEDSDLIDRTDHSLVLNFTHVLCAQAIVQPYYRFQYTHFTAGQQRDDYLNTIGIALHCPLTRQISLRAFVSYDIMKTSSSFAQDYNKLDAGGGLGLTMRF